MKTLFAPFAICACLVFAACHKNDDNNNTSLSKSEEAFMIQAAYANQNETAAGTLAATQALDATVKAFGVQMAAEHAVSYAELKTIANGYNYSSLPSSPDSMHQLLKDSLMMLSGHAFDSAYIASQVRDHQVAVELFQNEANNGTGALKDYAVKYLPHIQEHLARADSIQANF